MSPVSSNPNKVSREKYPLGIRRIGERRPRRCVCGPYGPICRRQTPNPHHYGERAGQGFTRVQPREGTTLGDVVEPLIEARLIHARMIAQKAGAGSIATEVKLGDPAEMILECARTNGAEAVVVGRRGRGRLKGLLIGSVSQKLVSLCEYPVIVVP